MYNFFTHGQNTFIAFDYLCKKEKKYNKNNYLQKEYN